jgi:hypothetical protein
MPSHLDQTAELKFVVTTTLIVETSRDRFRSIVMFLAPRSNRHQRSSRQPGRVQENFRVSDVAHTRVSLA